MITIAYITGICVGVCNTIALCENKFTLRARIFATGILVGIGIFHVVYFLISA